MEKKYKKIKFVGILLIWIFTIVLGTNQVIAEDEKQLVITCNAVVSEGFSFSVRVSYTDPETRIMYTIKECSICW
jgi:hypothetical protein